MSADKRRQISDLLNECQIRLFHCVQISPEKALKPERGSEGESDDSGGEEEITVDVPYQYEDYEIVEKEVSSWTGGCRTLKLLSGAVKTFQWDVPHGTLGLFCVS